MRFRAEVEYDGTNYHGFQRQLEEPTIQQELEQAIAIISGEQLTVTGAGRTDAGAHATGQVIAFNLDWRHSQDELLRAINANLPEDIALRALSEVKPEFHPRFDARVRTYEYHIYNAPYRRPLLRKRSWHIKKQLDMKAMDRVADAIIGVHDFATFGQPPQGEKTVREVYRSFWRREGDTLVFVISANAFLKRMVRSLVGTMRRVGDGSWTTEDFVRALMACDRSLAGKTAPAHGLYLTAVSYELDYAGE
jgi:tRNA pseudouridine38-40 synthase